MFCEGGQHGVHRHAPEGHLQGVPASQAAATAHPGCSAHTLLAEAGSGLATQGVRACGGRCSGICPSAIPGRGSGHGFLHCLLLSPPTLICSQMSAITGISSGLNSLSPAWARTHARTQTNSPQGCLNAQACWCRQVHGCSSARLLRCSPPALASRPRTLPAAASRQHPAGICSRGRGGSGPGVPNA
jgi:hypothetical protein